MRIALLSVLALTGCDFDFDLDFTGRSVGLVSDYDRLTVTGCAVDGLLGCEDSPESFGRMDAVIDGELRPVPRRTPGAFELFPQHSFELTVPSPADPYIGLALDSTALTVEELPWFDLDAPAEVHRAAGAVTVRLSVFPKAAVEVALTSECNGRQQFETVEAVVDGGRMAIPLTNPAFEGACTHEVRVTQTVDPPSDTGIFVATSRIERAMITSTN
jgi:hypothetical protein